MPASGIRNFVIIAHVDHGKSTLADRMLELTGTVEQRKMQPQYLDRMDLERERGITIKMQPVRMLWHPQAQSEKCKAQNEVHSTVLPFSLYVLNLIDTPGHADFAYEVSRSLAAVEGAILLVDATQGVQAQTRANLHLAEAEGLTIIPVINKIDLPQARVEETASEIALLTGVAPDDILHVSAKNGTGVPAVLERIVARLPPPGTARAALPRALTFDSHFDPFRGVIAHVRVFDGAFRRGDRIFTVATQSEAEIGEVGYFAPALAPAPELGAGEIGYIATGLKDPEAVRVGDTITSRAEALTVRPLAGYQEPAPVVFAGVYPEDPGDYPRLADALKKMKLNDAALAFEPESSDALGRGWRMGFLGMLHMEIAGARLEREYGLALIFAAPSVAYRSGSAAGGPAEFRSAARFPDDALRAAVREPWVRVLVLAPQRFLGSVLELLGATRGAFAGQEHRGERVVIGYDVPLRDVLVEFSDGLKRVTEGYGSFSYEHIGYRPAHDLVRLDIFIAGERELAFSQVVAGEQAYRAGRAAVARLKTLIPKQLFPVSLQAAAGGRVLARETISALKKDVTGYLYGGDRTRKMKLWSKQKRGKKRLAAGGRVEIPPTVFLQMLRGGPAGG